MNVKSVCLFFCLMLLAVASTGCGGDSGSSSGDCPFETNHCADINLKTSTQDFTGGCVLVGEVGISNAAPDSRYTVYSNIKSILRDGPRESNRAYLPVASGVTDSQGRATSSYTIYHPPIDIVAEFLAITIFDPATGIESDLGGSGIFVCD